MIRAFQAALAFLACVGCSRMERGLTGGTPPPAEYVGTWEAEGERLEIQSTGSLYLNQGSSGQAGSFIRLDDGVMVVALVLSGERRLSVERAPRRDPDMKWRMRIDGVDVVRVQ